MAIIPSQVFQRLLFSWFDLHGRKHLPWQENKTPYRVWISEIMLQQTQVTTVIPYFLNFMSHFPDIAALANATEDEVLRHWAGLGYYSRARNLHRSAMIIHHQYQDIFPDTLEKLQRLPGIGRSTAAAILSIAFNQPAAILDGNVKRVLTRFHAITSPINDKQTENTLWKLAENHLPNHRYSDYTQAIMDLGATICKRRKPDCLQCPLNKQCKAYQQNLAEALPIKKQAPKLPIRKTTFLIFKKNQSILLAKRPSTGIWGGLWSFPETTNRLNELNIADFCKTHFKVGVSHCTILDTFRHTFTHYHLNITPIVIHPLALPFKNKEGYIWYHLKKAPSVGLPKPVQKILKGLS